MGGPEGFLLDAPARAAEGGVRMGEYICRQKALEEMHKWCDPCGSGIESILAVPTADVAPVVRCRDCEHSWEDISGRICSYGPLVDCIVPDDFGCVNGKRRGG